MTAFRQGQALREAFLGPPVARAADARHHDLRRRGGAREARQGARPRRWSNEILSDIASESDRLYRLVEDLLVLARFDEGFELGDEPALLQHLVPAVVDQERGRWPLVTSR